MSDLFRIGNSALLNAQRAISVTGHNISNVGNESFSRQSVSINSRDPLQRGGVFLGQGSQLAGINRNANDFIDNQIRQFASSFGRFDSEASYLSRLERLISSGGNNIADNIQSFFNAAQELAASPTDIAGRQAFLGAAQTMINQAKSIDSAFSSLNTEINANITATVQDINQIANSIAQLNKRISASNNFTQQGAAADLLDQRDGLLKDLASKIGIDTIQKPDGSVDVFIGQGRTLIKGGTNNTISVRQDAGNRNLTELFFDNNPAQTIKNIDAGSLQGLMTMRDKYLTPNQSRIGLLLFNLADAFNTVHKEGIDLYGNQGENFFSVPNVQVENNANNTGNGFIQVLVDNSVALRPSRYTASFDGTDWTITRQSDGTAVSGSPLNSLTFDGMSFDISAGVPAAGDSFQFNPAANFISSLDIGLIDLNKIAAARLEFSTAADPANTGSMRASIIDTSRPDLFPGIEPIVVTYSDTAAPPGVPGITINWNGGSEIIAYNPALDGGAINNFNIEQLGFSFSLRGLPADGDAITFTNQGAGRGNNKNMLAIADLALQPLARGGNSLFTDEYSAIVSSIGVSAGQALSNQAIERSFYDEAFSFRESLSGVNLDEEFANLLRFQQLYQASAQFIRVADSLFQTLINSL
jgi:flagellar hook-associated protein 1